MNILRALLLCAVLTAAACAGDTGPQGPAGPKGDTGEQGPPGPIVDRGNLPCPGPIDGGPETSPRLNVVMVDIGASCINATASELPNGTSFANAASACRHVGRRLCTYAEWYLACSQFSSEVTGMTDNWERIDVAYANGDGGVTTLVVGEGGCEAGREASPNEGLSYRCCL